MRDFSQAEIEIIKTHFASDPSSLNEILFSGSYDDCKLYLLSTKIPMDDWDLSGVYFSEKEAWADADRHINLDIPTSVSVDPRSIGKIREVSKISETSKIWEIYGYLQYQVESRLKWDLGREIFGP